ncbi:hypothetical protein DPMN_109189 [Dreissena polymorpha]|uniref:Uncharacterized protein n=1 Tax=Dreissena polymorpha TaxID=45954 RepID=A0A9D4K9U8_DREPO|nr:hypothetical protein DPMN_109189 [Dreissena polymorpha]
MDWLDVSFEEEVIATAQHDTKRKIEMEVNNNTVLPPSTKEQRRRRYTCGECPYM